MDTDVYEDGFPCWVELATPHADTVEGFYRQLFGWDFTAGPGGESESRTCLLRGRAVAAIRTAPGAESAAWTTYINVADAAETAEKVVAAGGRVLLAPHRVGAAGTAALFADHSGTTFGVWQPDTHPGARIRGEHGTFHAGELITDDMQASASFYGQVFGWTLTQPHGPLGRRDWQLAGSTVCVALPRPPAMPAEIPPYWDVMFTVADAEQAAGTAVGLGATLLMPATATEHGTIAVLADPAGAVFTVIATDH
ncbi:VOC family protein [Catenulispora rubra]|uniref:VOC family protein n=1 Tax=Catenulispora rubra TaxID=280293 RepID=UPI0018920581|nr:VOC family protein [Catenulispora rubra]